MTIYLSLGICLAAVVLCIMHVRSYRTVDHGGLSDEELVFFRRQYIRRLQTSGILGVVGLSLLGDLFAMDPVVSAAYWLFVLLLVVWMVVLAFADWLESRWFWSKTTQLSAEEKAFLAEEIARYKREKQADGEDSAAHDG